MVGSGVVAFLLAGIVARAGHLLVGQGVILAVGPATCGIVAIIVPGAARAGERIVLGELLHFPGGHPCGDDARTDAAGNQNQNPLSETHFNSNGMACLTFHYRTKRAAMSVR
ncbi:hypothetical protein [Novosphingobium sp. ST904]|uniref:hypothetical protein n=1 Tax=Novosphingobium sp. ST904 TaxID=1684385 RepID=UPI0006C8684A|nr:hypothetical protein [Novosphingobium sp. ST904]